MIEISDQRIYDRCIIEDPRLTSENAKLREEFDKLNAKFSDLKAENAKLRELVKYMWFSDYAWHFSTLPEHQDNKAAVWNRMRELGIEVDE